MENQYNPWTIFHSTDMGDNLEEVVENEDCKVLRMKAPNSDMVFPESHYHGITIVFFLDYAEKSVREAMPSVSADLSALAEKF